MATVDSLNIQISAQASSASASIENLSRKLNILSTSLSSINGSGLSGLSSGVQRLSKSVQTLNGVKTSDFTRIAKGFEKFAEINVSGLSKAAGGLNTLSRSLSSLSSIQNLGNITPAINAIKNLARVDMTGFDTDKMQSISKSVYEFANRLSFVKDIDSKVVRLVNAMARLSNSGQYIENVTTSFPSLGNQVVKLVKNLAAAGTIDINTAKVVDGIARLASAGRKAKETTQNLKSLGDSVMNLLNRLKHAPAINTNIANTIQGLGNLAASGSRISTVANNASAKTSKLGNALKILKEKLNGTDKSFKGLASRIGMFYAKAFLLIRAVKKLGDAIGSAQDYIEEFNYFSVALDKIGKDSADQFKKAGYNSAEEYAKSFRTRFAKLQTQMTGYEVDYDTGEAMSRGIHNLGLDLTEVMNFNAAISQITNSAGMLGETSIMASKALSMLSADWHSLSNQDLSDVMNNMQSALIGQSRAVYKYGIDITSAGLAQTALNHGIKASIKDLSQQSKMQLRVLTMLEQSKVAYGDLARTINQPANQLRMLQAGFKNLSRSIGNLFLPVVQKIYPYLNAIVMVLNEFVQWVAKIAGINLGDVSGISFPDIEEPADDMDNYADATDKAAKKQKKLNDNLQGFDIINKLQKDESDSDDKKDKKNKNLDLSKDISSALANYEKIWDKAFKSNQNKAVQLAKNIKKALLDGWNMGGDFTELGKKLGAWINKGMNKMPWDKIKKTTKKIVKSIATFLNGLVEGLDWNLIGKTMSEGLNTAIESAYTWWTTFKWLEFGTSLATMLNSALKNLDTELLGKTLGAKLRGMVQFAFGFITNFDFTELGINIASSINGFFEEMGEVRQNTGLTGWQELGKTISDSVSGILTTINTALSNVRWTEVGKAIGDFIRKIRWGEIFVKIGTVVVNALWSSVKVAVSALANDPFGIVSAVTNIMIGWFSVKGLSAVKKTLKTNFSNILSNALIGAINKLETSGIKSLLQTKLGKIGAIAISLTIAVESIKWSSEQWSNLYNKYTEKEVREALTEMFTDVFRNIYSHVGDFVSLLAPGFSSAFSSLDLDEAGEIVSQKLGGALGDFFDGLGQLIAGRISWDNIKEGFSSFLDNFIGETKDKYRNMVSWIVEKFSSGWGSIKNVWNGAKNFFSAVWSSIKGVFANTKDWFLNKFTKAKNAVIGAWGGIKKFFSDLWSGIKGVFTNGKSVPDWFKGIFGNAWSGIRDIWDKATGFFKGIWSGIKDGAKSPLNGLLGFFEGVANKVIDAWNAIIDSLNKIKIEIPKGIPKIGGTKLGFNLEKSEHVTIKRFKLGGFPEDGLFYANHNELVGQFTNGRTAVVNNGQIVKGIAEGIGPTVYAAVKQAMREQGTNSSEKVLVVDKNYKQIATGIVNEINSMTRSRGNSPLVSY